jgi:uncharacterized membrane protein YkvA (DUF1232 family)
MRKKEDELRALLDTRVARVGPAELEKVIEQHEKIREICDDAAPLHTHKETIETMADMVQDSKKGDYYVPWRTIAAIVGTLLYVVWPLDLIPDFIPIAGWIDDATVVSMCISLIKEEINEYQLWRATRDESEKKGGC